MAEAAAPVHWSLDRVECVDCGARIDDPPVPADGDGHTHRWRYGAAGSEQPAEGSPAARAPRRRFRWYRELEWWLNATGAADVHALTATELLHPPGQRCWSSYCSHCAGPGR